MTYWSADLNVVWVGHGIVPYGGEKIILTKDLN